MTALGTNLSIGTAIDGLFSAAFTLTMGIYALQGLQKVGVVARRGVNEMLKMCYFDTEKTGSFANKVTAWVPEMVSDIFKDDSGYNRTRTIKKDVPVLGENGKPIVENGKTKTESKEVKEYVKGWPSLLISGLALSVLSLIALEAKEALWRPANPILNYTLSYISPFRYVMGQSWVASGINKIVGAIKARL